MTQICSTSLKQRDRSAVIRGSTTSQREVGHPPKVFEDVIWQEIQKQSNGKLSLSGSTHHVLNLHISFLFRRIIRVHLEVGSWWIRRLLKLQVNFPDMLNAGIRSAQ